MTGASMGNVGWGWDDVRPYFERSERRVDAGGPRSAATDRSTSRT